MKILSLIAFLGVSGVTTILAGPPALPFPGTLQTMHSRDIEDSRWSIGGETLDRDYADFEAYREFLGRSGATRVRLQAGWAKTERVRGEYDFAWLDAIVDGAVAEGVRPWLQISYGNPLYEGGGQPVLGGGIPTSEEALAAWDAWVEATVRRYRDRVTEWEIWNEADLSGDIGPADFAAFHARTSAVIRRAQPEARIVALSIAYIDRTEYVTALLDLFREQDRLDEFEILSYHGYTSRPERAYPFVSRLREVVDAYRPGIELWQGEQGAPSTPRGTTIGALSREDWSETTQAKWNLRRMLGDAGHDVAVINIFTLSDLRYAKEGDHMIGLNTKGLLITRADHSVVRPKLSFGAFQRVATLFRGDLERVREAGFRGGHEDLWTFAFIREDVPGAAVVLWFGEAKPTDDYAFRPVDLAISGIHLDDPVYVDLLTGDVREVSADHVSVDGDTVLLRGVPVADYPVVLVNRAWLDLCP
ncbi:MAG: hypothetical protein JJT96_11075 [Opitutales bacterium]|nr:hypothetical protein [Opitutales bacterium]